MMNVRNTGIQQMMARTFSASNQMMARQIRNIASGYRINSAADDASGLAISKKLNALITGLDTASLNAQDTISMLQTAEGALDQVSSITNRMTELATRAGNGILSATERGMIQQEYDQLASEIDRIGQSSTFNGIKLFDGNSHQMQIGATSKDTMKVEMGELSAKSLGLDKVDLTTQAGAGNALDSIRNAIQSVSSQRSTIGAAENGVQHAINTNENASLNLQESFSRIADTDIAKAATNRSISQTLNATSIAMLKNSMYMMQYNAVSMLMK
ncbi:MAG: flagellin [Anaerotruncus sp.]|nr:flagellin [Anaerotruncus sp.]